MEKYEQDTPKQVKVKKTQFNTDVKSEMVHSSENSSFSDLQYGRKTSDFTYDSKSKPKKSILKHGKRSESDINTYMYNQVRIDKFGNKIDDQKKQHICIDQEVVEHTVENWKELNQDVSQENGCACCLI